MTRIAASTLLLGFVSGPPQRSQNGFPPFDVERLAASDDQATRLRITVAVAGFASDDLDLSVEDGQLMLRGRRPPEERERTYLHRGIATRAFQRSFPLAEGVEVARAHLQDGLLTIELARPEPQRTTRKVDITVPV